MPGRKSNSDILWETHGVDYDQTLLQLSEKGLTPEDISEILEDKYQIHTTASTVHAHLTRVRKKNLGRASISKKLQDKGVSDYRAFLESLCHMSQQEIAEYIERRYSIKVSAATIYNHCREFNITLQAADRKVRTLPEIKSKITYFGKHHQRRLIERDLPYRVFFNGTDSCGYIPLVPVAGVVFEVVTSLEVSSQEEGQITLFLRAFKDLTKAETKILHVLDVSDILPDMTNGNYISLCKQKVKPLVEDLLERSPFSLLQLLKKEARKPREMAHIIHYLEEIT